MRRYYYVEIRCVLSRQEQNGIIEQSYGFPSMLVDARQAGDHLGARNEDEVCQRIEVRLEKALKADFCGVHIRYVVSVAPYEVGNPGGTNEE